MVDVQRSADPFVSVILPCRNGASTLAGQLDALARQTFRGRWELLLMDNQSTDGSAALARGYRAAIRDLRIEPTGARGVGAVRNAGARLAKGELLLFCDADDIVVDEWIEAMVAAAQLYDIVGGRLDDSSVNPPSVRAWRGGIPQDELMTRLDFLPYAPGGNCAVWRDVVDEVGGWATDYRAGSEDADFSWRAQQRGFRVGFAPAAAIAYRYRDGLMAACRQYFTYGFTEVQLFRRFRDSPAMPRAGWRDLARVWRQQLRDVRHVLRSSDERGRWLVRTSFHLGRLWGSLRCRVLCP